MANEVQDDCLCTIEGAHYIYRMKGGLPADWLDSLILRLNEGRTKYRSHFPVILETNMNFYFNDAIYVDMKQSQWSFATVECAKDPVE